MLVTEVSNALPGGSSLLRNEPVQARSSARLAGLLDAAAAVIDEIGFERLTTAMVAERAGASIGTVYRYFPDRIAVVEALAVRCSQRLAERFDAVLDATDASTWQEGSDALIEATVDMYRSEPGFRAIRFGGDAGAPTDHDDDRLSALGQTVKAKFHAKFGTPDTPRVSRAFVVVTEAGHAVLARAHRGDEPDEELVAEYRAMSRGYFAAVFEAESA